MSSRLQPWNVEWTHYKVRVFDNHDIRFRGLSVGVAMLNYPRREVWVRQQDVVVLQIAIKSVQIIQRIMETSKQ